MRRDYVIRDKLGQGQVCALQGMVPGLGKGRDWAEGYQPSQQMVGRGRMRPPAAERRILFIFGCPWTLTNVSEGRTVLVLWMGARQSSTRDAGRKRRGGINTEFGPILLRLLLLLCRCVVVDHQPPLSMGFSKQEYRSRLPCSPPRHLPHPGIEPEPPEPAGEFSKLSPQGSPMWLWARLKPNWAPTKGSAATF